ncbi:MAG TPA: YIP1 family protein [Rhodobacteraceae bacterium]|nr:YIP1 family protein [Paracoccaceae bacterium]
MVLERHNAARDKGSGMSEFPIFRELVVQSVTDPAGAAARILALNLGREAVWTGLFLAVVLNTIMFVISDMLMPPPPPEMAVFDMPAVVYFGFMLGGLLVTAVALHKVGRGLGGTGEFAEILVLLVWLQILRVLALAAVLVLTLTVPLLAMLATLATGLYGLYIMLHFIDQAHRLNSLGRSAGVLIASVLAVALGLVVLLQLAGV